MFRILFTALCLWQSVLAAPKIDCPEIISKGNRTIAKAAFSSGLENESITAAYYGLSMPQVRKLIYSGTLEVPAREIYFSLKATTENRTAADLPREHNLYPRAEQIAKANLIATRYARFEIIRSRMRDKPSRHGEDMLWELVRNTPSSSKKNAKVSITLKDVYAAFPIFEIGADLTGYERTLKFASEIGWSKKPMDSDDIQALMAALADLPAEAGYTIGLNPTVLKEKRLIERQTVTWINLADVTGIEPLGNDDYVFLEELLKDP